MNTSFSLMSIEVTTNQPIKKRVGRYKKQVYKFLKKLTLKLFCIKVFSGRNIQKQSNILWLIWQKPLKTSNTFVHERAAFLT
jgi:hypothetical protein